MSKPGSLVLLIEGEPKMRSFLRSGFEIHGFSVVEAENAADGLKIAAFKVTHDQLLREIWTGSQRDNIQYLRILVRKVRQKIEPDPNQPRLLIAESGVGYRLEKGPETSATD